MDCCCPFTVIQRGNKYVLLAICLLTKYAVAKAVAYASSTNAAQFWLNVIVLVHGCFKELQTDRGTHFTRTIVQDVLKLLDFKQLLTSSYHAYCDGTAERPLKSFGTIISNYT